MDIISLSQMDDWMTGLSAVLVISVLLLGPYIVSGLSTALRMLQGRLKNDLISGRLGYLRKPEWFTLSSYGSVHKKVMMELDGLDQPIIFKNLRVGPKLKRSKVFQPGGRLIMLVHKKKQGFNKVDLLAISNGREIFISPKDVFTLYGLDWAQVFFLAAIGIMAGLRFLTPLLSDWGSEIEVLVAVLACGLVPATVMCVLYRRASANFLLQARSRLEDFARTWNPEGDGRSSRIRPLSLPVDNVYAVQAAGFALTAVPPLGLVLAVVFLIFDLLTDLISAFTRSDFEMRPLKIESFDEIRKSASHSIYLKNAVLLDPISGASKKIKKLFTADSLFKKGLMNPGVSGLWLIQAGKLGHPAMNETKGSLRMFGYIDDAPDAAADLDPSDILPIHIQSLYMAPLQGALIGACAIISVTQALTGAWPAPADYQWLIPWTILFTFLKFMARRRINSAVVDCLKNRPVSPNISNIKYMEARGAYDPQTF